MSACCRPICWPDRPPIRFGLCPGTLRGRRTGVVSAPTFGRGPRHIGASATEISDTAPPVTPTPIQCGFPRPQPADWSNRPICLLETPGIMPSPRTCPSVLDRGRCAPAGGCCSITAAKNRCRPPPMRFDPFDHLRAVAAVPDRPLRRRGRLRSRSMHARLTPTTAAGCRFEKTALTRRPSPASKPSIAIPIPDLLLELFLQEIPLPSRRAAAEDLKRLSDRWPRRAV